MNKENAKISKKIYAFTRNLLTRFSPKVATKIMYRISTGKKLDLKNPKDFNQKIMWLKLNTYYKNPLITQCADKYAVRKYIEENGCGKILNRLIGVYDTTNQIEWESLPKKFVLKCNHGCGMNIICDNKDKANKNEILRKLDIWMKEDYYLDHAEVNYKYIKKKIICEEYLQSKEGFLPNDYKIYCFNGEPKIVLVCYERDINLQLQFLELDWKKTRIGKGEFDKNINIPKPKTFDTMIEYSKKLSKGFPFVRMDFYEIDDKVIFGEMTFTPAGGLANYYSQYGLKFLGNQLHLPIK